jgi:hypothetical protein
MARKGNDSTQAAMPTSDAATSVGSDAPLPVMAGRLT